MAKQRDENGIATDLNPGLVQRVANGVRGAAAGLVAGAFYGWFGPQAPMAPVAPPDTAGRQFDYSYGINLNYSPRNEPGQVSIPFSTLRRLAEPAEGGLDLVRLAVQTRKDQMSAQPWGLRAKGGDGDGGPKGRRFEAWMEYPDGFHTFDQWMRMVLEEHFVIDAVAILPFPAAVQGARPILDIVDGATIKRVITSSGRTPIPPLPAYQQILVGLPAVDYTTAQLAYYPFNPRAHRLYGMSHVEQVVTTITLALNRFSSTLSYYTQGTVPDAFASVPDSWTKDQIKDLQEWWNATMSGNLGARRGMWFVPGGRESVLTFPREKILKDEMDEWIARVVCDCFSLPPTPYIKQMNRATSDTAKESAQEQGLESTKKWWSKMITDLLARAGAPELEWFWQDEEIVDPQEKMQVIIGYRGGTTGAALPIITLDEARSLAGFDPLSPKEREELDPEPEPPPALPPGGGQRLLPAAAAGKEPPLPPASEPAAKAARDGRGRSLRRVLVPRDDKRTARTERQVGRIARRALAATAARVVAAARGSASKLAGDAGDRAKAAAAAANPLDGHEAAIEAALEAMATASGEAALRAVLPEDDAHFEDLLHLVRTRGAAWARARVGNLVTQVSATTREEINELTAEALEDGVSMDEYADILQEAFAFSKERAVMIARTETAFADIHGALLGFTASGVVEKKEWSADADACDECAPLDGVMVGLDEDFPDDGGDGPPLHPNCRCSIVAVVEEH